MFINFGISRQPEKYLQMNILMKKVLTMILFQDQNYALVIFLFKLASDDPCRS